MGLPEVYSIFHEEGSPRPADPRPAFKMIGSPGPPEAGAFSPKSGRGSSLSGGASQNGAAFDRDSHFGIFMVI